MKVALLAQEGVSHLKRLLGAHHKINRPLKEANLGVAKLYFTLNNIYEKITRF